MTEFSNPTPSERRRDSHTGSDRRSPVAPRLAANTLTAPASAGLPFCALFLSEGRLMPRDAAIALELEALATYGTGSRARSVAFELFSARRRTGCHAASDAFSRFAGNHAPDRNGAGRLSEAK